MVRWTCSFRSHSLVFQLLIVALFVGLFPNNFFFFKTVTCQTFTFISIVQFVWFIFFVLCFFHPCFFLFPVVLPITCSLFHTMSLWLFAVNFSFFHSSHPLFISFSSSSSSPRVTLDPTKRQSSNKSMSGCTLPQGTKTVSKSSFPMFSGCFCLPDCLLASSLPPPLSLTHSLSVAFGNVAVHIKYLLTATCIMGLSFYNWLGVVRLNVIYSRPTMDRSFFNLCTASLTGRSECIPMNSHKLSP